MNAAKLLSIFSKIIIIFSFEDLIFVKSEGILPNFVLFLGLLYAPEIVLLGILLIRFDMTVSYQFKRA